MKNKTILALAIASTLGLTACGDETTELRIDETISDSLNRQSSIAFDLISTDKTLSIPSYLLMNTSDGTLDIPTTGDLTDRSNPAVAMGDTDGWSPTQPFVIELDLPTGVTLTTDSARLHSAVKIAKVTVSSTKVMSDPVALTAGVDYTVISTGTSLNVLPLNGSLEHDSDYIYAITDSLVDSSGEKLGMSSNYAALKNKQIDQTGTALEVPQKIIWQAEGLMDAYGIADYENIIYSSWFTTSSAGNALYAVKAMTASTLQATGNGSAVWPGDANPAGKDLTGFYAFSNPTPVDINTLKAKLDAYQIPSSDVDFTGLNVNEGTIKLPSFLELDPTTYNKTPWESAIPSLAIISGILNSGTDEEKLDLGTKLFLGTPSIDANELEDPTEQLKLIGQSFTKLDNTTKLDSERLITKYSPFPKVKDVQDVPYLLITPNGAAPGTVPVVIYQHGITSLKENILASGDALINGYAILAIDLPLHGERALIDGTVTTPLTADVFMNLEYLTVARDNMRQAVADLIGLRAGLNLIIATPGTELDVLDTSNVSFFGHSLGAMSGISLQATIEKTMAGNAYFAIDKAAFANPGGGVPYLLANSDFFGGTIKHGLMQSASTDYQGFSGAACALDPINNPEPAKPYQGPTACFDGFYAAAGDAQATVDANIQSFAVAAQTVLETVDPFALAREISDTTPVYLAQVNGDAVIPNIVTIGTGEITDATNGAPYSPIAGTTPLITQLNLDNIKGISDTIKKVALLGLGDHSSAIVYNPAYNPDANVDYPAGTVELQSHITSFLASSSGATATIIDPSLLLTE